MITGEIRVGDRVRMVQTTSIGTIVRELYSSTVDGDDRVDVRWDNSGTTTGWNPRFLRPVDTDPADDPDEVVVGEVIRRKGKAWLDKNGVWIVVSEGFSRRKESP